GADPCLPAGGNADARRAGMDPAFRAVLDRKAGRPGGASGSRRQEGLQDLKTDIKVSQARYEGKKEMAEYYINDLYYQIHHKFYRAWDEIKEIQSFLQKDGFIVRTKPKEVPPPPKKVRIEEI
ncbi:hypothetical protein VF07_29910, partial [Nostoc linckia z6]